MIAAGSPGSTSRMTKIATEMMNSVSSRLARRNAIALSIRPAFVSSSARRVD
jgi:hypothetical protein